MKVNDEVPKHTYGDDTLLNRLTFDRLGQALNVLWPTWYRSLILALLDHPRPHGDWLPGGFLFARPELIQRDTQSYRDGHLQLFRGEAHSESFEETDWSSSLVVVGHHGGGSVVVDTATDEQVLLEIDKDTYILRPFVSLRDAAATPEGFAALLVAADDDRGTGKRHRR